MVIAQLATSCLGSCQLLGSVGSSRVRGPWNGGFWLLPGEVFGSLAAQRVATSSCVIGLIFWTYVWILKCISHWQALASQQ